MSFKISMLPFLAATLFSCGSIQPEAPEVSILEKYEIPKQPVSVVKVPIKINLAPYFKETNKNVPQEFRGADHPCSGVGYEYYFIRKPIDFKGIGSNVQFEVEGSYNVKIDYCPECTSLINEKGNCIIPRVYFSCGVNEPLRKMYVAYNTEIGVSNSYKLTANTTLKKVKSQSPCEVTVFNYNATERLEKEVTTALKSVEKDIDKAISSVDLRPTISQTWQALTAPLDLQGYGYLFLNPKEVAINNLRYWGDTAYFDAYLTAFPYVKLDTVGFRPTKLPNLTEFVADDGFDISMDVIATYDSLSNILTRELSGMKTEVKGKEVIFETVSIHGAANNQLHFKVGFSGKKSGELYLTGTPHFNLEKQTISFPDMEFDIKTRSALLKSAKWLFDKRITELLRSSANFALNDYMEKFKATVDSNLNGEIRDGVQMKGHIDAIRVDLIHPQAESLFIRLNTTGHLRIRL